jgi:hypothetical protein
MCLSKQKLLVLLKLKHSIKINKKHNENATKTSYEEKKFLHTTCWRSAYKWRNSDHAVSKKYWNVHA